MSLKSSISSCSFALLAEPEPVPPPLLSIVRKLSIVLTVGGGFGGGGGTSPLDFLNPFLTEHKEVNWFSRGAAATGGCLGCRLAQARSPMHELLSLLLSSNPAEFWTVVIVVDT